jgi:hypothetical protein
MIGAEILALPMGPNDADAENVREYLKALLTELWREGESFSGKRPFGNSGWERELLENIEDHTLDPESAIFRAIEAL